MRYVADLGLKWRKSNFWKFGQEVDFLISGSECDSESWNNSVMLFGTFLQNLTSFRVDLLGFGTGFRSWKI